MTDSAVVALLGRRLAQLRLHADLTQAALAREAGIGKRTLERVERGQGCDLQTFIRILRALNILSSIGALVPEPTPVVVLKVRNRHRARPAARGRPA